MLALLAAAARGGEVSHPFVCSDNGHQKVFMVNAAGKITWQIPAVHAHDVWMMPGGGTLLYAEKLAVREVVVETQRVVWEYTTRPPNEIHACQPLANGDVLIGETGTCRIIEVGRDGAVHKEIKLRTTTKDPHLQFRQVRKTPAGTYLVAFTGEHVVRELDGEGKTLREFPAGKYVFSAIRLPNGHTLVACGDGHRLLEYDKAGEVCWSIEETELPGHPLRFVAGVQRLPNGNTVVCNWGGHGHKGQQPQVFEVTRDKKVVWQVHDDERFRFIPVIQLLDVEGDVTKGEILR
jgi:hypothetical protein